MERKYIYLAGPITGLTYGDSRYGWREQISSKLPEHIIPYSPMRGKEYLKETFEKQDNLPGTPDAHSHPHGNMASAITARDHNDVMNCDLMVANFLGATKASVGTCIEFGWASAYRKPIVMIVEPNGIIEDGVINPHYHMMMYDLAGFMVHDLETAAGTIEYILSSGV